MASFKLESTEFSTVYSILSGVDLEAIRGVEITRFYVIYAIAVLNFILNSTNFMSSWVVN